jgi:poly(3-hydroxybutyrate) depolymerase
MSAMPPRLFFSTIPASAALLAAALVLGACGGGGGGASDTPAATDQLVSTTVTGFQSAVDIYRTAGATRAIVLLHGGGGNKSAIAYQVGLNSDAGTTTGTTINWAWLDANKVMLVVPQGQHLPTEPNGSTWTNHAMNSGQDDKAFLQALVARIRGEYGIAHVTLMGHSMGGVMTNRMWCESPGSFDAYVSLAGPASSAFNQAGTPCAPASARPYMGIIGDSDDIMRTAGAWAAATWTVNPAVVLAAETAWDNDVVIGEFHQQQARTTQVCGGTLASNDFTHAGQVDTWTSCGGRLVLKRVLGGEHGVSSLDAQMGAASPLDVMNAVMAFVTAN